MIMGLALAPLLQACVTADRDGGWARCGRNAQLEVVDLNMYPDPVSSGDRIERFRVSIRSDARTDCETRVQIRETQGGDLIGRDSKYRLRRGVNRIEIEPEGRYRFNRQEHCFVVVADLEGNWWPLDAVRKYCARRTGNRYTLNS
jgi:hypothetical protein